MALKRIALWVLTAVSSIFPAWFLVNATIGIDVQLPGLAGILIVIIFPVLAMATMTIWALRVEASSDNPDRKPTWKEKSALSTLVYIWAFIVLHRSLKSEESKSKNGHSA